MQNNQNFQKFQKITVQIESTPNPATMKFNLSQKILEQGMDFPSVEDTESSPLANKLFGFPWTNSVFIGTNFITITKQDWVDWEILTEPLAGLIQEHLEHNLPVYQTHPKDRTQNTVSNNMENEDDPMIVKQIKAILDREIRPAVAMDGGDIVFGKYEDNILSLHMRGACSGCPSSKITLKDGIEIRMKELLPEIKEVVSI